MQEGRADMKEVCRRKEQCGDTGAISRKHKAYKLTCCVDAAQEEQSARMPPSTVLGGLCQASRLFRGCKVVLSRNVSYL